MSAPAPGKTQTASPPSRVGRFRWYVCGLLFYATTVNYVDRQVLSLLKPVISHDLGWNEATYGWIVFSFQAAYAIIMPIAGRVIDWLGTRTGYTLAVLVWSCAAMAHSLARSSLQFAVARFALGFGEAANFPAAIKTVADWFPKRERALATGVFNSGSNIGALIAPLLVPFIASRFGWRPSFLVTGALDVVWIIVWLTTYRSPRENKRVSPAELAYIESDPVEPSRRVPYLTLLSKRAAWAFLLGKFLTDPAWWFYLYWFPGFLNQKYGINLSHLGPPLIAVYLAADVGSIGGGWISSHLLARGRTVTRARKTALLTCAVVVLPVVFVMTTHGNVWATVLLVSLAAAGHQGWSANLYTLVSDTFPRSEIASVVGLGGMGGAIGGALVNPAIGYWLDFSHQLYAPLFVIAGSVYLIAFFLIHRLVPRLEQVHAPIPSP